MLPRDERDGTVVNLKGFVGRRNGEDRDLAIKVGDRFIKRFSVGGGGDRYPIVVSRKGMELWRAYLEVKDVEGQK